MSNDSQHTGTPHTPLEPALYIVGTPIGNLQDITLRALNVLHSVSLILCEDTRRARILCRHYAIDTPLRSCHAHNERTASRSALSQLKSGMPVAYISDAGTPAISDPGARLVTMVRAADYRVIPIPGASALTALLSVGGITDNAFSFAGFLPRTAGKRAKIVHQYLVALRPFVLYESPYRLIKLLQQLAHHAPHRRLVLGRELTKIYEEILSGNAQQLLEIFSKKNPKGECTLLVTTEEIM